MKKMLTACTCDCHTYPTLYTEILEWMYTHDGVFDSRNDWRSGFVAYLKDLFDVNTLDIDSVNNPHQNCRCIFSDKREE